MRRGLSVLLALLALAVVGGALAAVAFLRGYEPLVRGSSWGPTHPQAVRISAAPGSGGKEVFMVENRGGTVYAGFTVRNSGRFDVTIDGPRPRLPKFVAEGTASVIDLRVAPYEPFPSPGGGSWALVPLRSTVPLKTLRVPSGEERTIWIGYRLHKCLPGFAQVGGGSMSSVLLRYRYLGVFRRTAWVEMPFAVTLFCGDVSRWTRGLVDDPAPGAPRAQSSSR